MTGLWQRVEIEDVHEIEGDCPSLSTSKLPNLHPIFDN